MADRRPRLSSARLSMLALIKEGILEPGERLLTFDYMGKRCEADLLPDGLIQWNGSKYSSPYAWASQCKNQVNPDHKSGIGWGHIRYKGIKLSQYKTVYIKKHQLSSPERELFDEALDLKQMTRQNRRKRILSTHQEILKPSLQCTELSPCIQSECKDSTSSKIPLQSETKSSSQTHVMTSTVSKPDILYDCAPFSVYECHQPFTISVTSNVLMIMDFHCHLNVNEVRGYLGGKFDQEKRKMEIMEVFPCKCDFTDAMHCNQVESEVKASLEKKGLVLVGWYHSHPISEAKPSQNDIVSQKQFQDSVRRDNGDEPCIGFILSPNHGGFHASPITKFQLFYIIVVNQDGVKVAPMTLEYSVLWESYLTQEIVDEMNSLASFYKSLPCCPKFMSLWKGELYFINKFKKSISEFQPKFPEENSDQTFMTYIDQLLGSQFKV